MIVTYLRDNLPRSADIEVAGQGRRHVRRRTRCRRTASTPARRSSSGAACSLLGVAVVGSGLVLDKLVPGLAYLRGDMQIAHMIHAVAAVLMMAMFCGHIYLGTVGMKGAYDGMRTGYVDEAWAQEHHGLWHDDIRAGKIPAQRTRIGRAADWPARRLEEGA